MDKGLTCPVTAVSLGAALARHTVGTQCVGLGLSSLHHTAELTELISAGFHHDSAQPRTASDTIITVIIII